MTKISKQFFIGLALGIITHSIGTIMFPMDYVWSSAIMAMIIIVALVILKLINDEINERNEKK